MDGARFEEEERGPASRVYKVRFSAERVAPKITARLNELARVSAYRVSVLERYRRKF